MTHWNISKDELNDSIEENEVQVEEFRCTKAVDDAVAWLKKNKKAIHHGSSAHVFIIIDKDW